MAETSTSLLDQLRRQPDAQVWQRLVELYQPLIRGWLRQFPVLQHDADDLVQEVLTVLVAKLGSFDRQRNGSFRRWLRGITVNCLREFWRARGRRAQATGDSAFLHILDELEDPRSSLSQVWERDHQRHLLQHLLERLRPRFEEQTWRAFQGVAVEGRAPGEVAQELGLTVNAVFIAKSRVLTLLRQEGEGLLE